mgnify:CR=1 FL=1
MFVSDVFDSKKPEAKQIAPPAFIFDNLFTVLIVSRRFTAIKATSGIPGIVFKLG